MRTVTRMCPLCEATCGLRLTLDDDDRVTRVQGDPDDPFSRGYLCPKGATLGQLAQDPDRLDAPMVRNDAGVLQATTWEHALDVVAARVRAVVAEHGTGALGTYNGNPNVHTAAGQLYVKPFVKALRTRHVYTASTVDQMPKHVSAGLMFGAPLAIPVPDIDRTDLLLVLGANPRMSNGSLCTAPDLPGRLDALGERGGRLVVVDPRRTRTAARADQHIAIRPGTDALLLAAVVTELAALDAVDPGPAGAHLDGLDTALAALQGFTADAVAAATRVDAETIRALAHDLAAADRPVVYGRIGTQAQRFGTLCAWLVDVCNTVLGSLDRPGGAMWTRPAHEVGKRPRPYAIGRWRSRVRDLPEVNGELPVATLADEITTPGEGQLRALFTVAGNPLRSTPNSDRLEAAFADLDLLVCVDPYVTATSRHADVILPPPGPLCEPHPELTFAELSVRNVTHHSPAVVDLPDGAMPEWRILLALAAIALGADHTDVEAADRVVAAEVAERVVSTPSSRLHGLEVEEALALTDGLVGPDRLVDLLWRAGPYGAGTGTAGLSLQAMLDAPSGVVDHGPLEPRLPDVLATATGRIVLAPDEVLADLPRLTAAMEAPQDGLLLVGRRHLRTNNSWGQNVPALMGSTDLCTLQVHPDDAAAHGLCDGGRAIVRSRVGAVEAPVEVTEDIVPGTVSLPHGFGNDEDGIRLRVAADVGGVNSNVLTDEQEVDAVSGNAVLNGIPVDVVASA